MEKHKYVELARRLRMEIQSSVYPVGQQLPSENELVAMTRYSRQTVRQAMGVLEQKGLTYQVQGSGTHVRSAPTRRQPTRSIVVVIIYIGEYILPVVLHGIDHTLTKNGHTPMLNAACSRVDNKRHVLTEPPQKPIDGTIMGGAKTALPNPNIDPCEHFAEMGIPVVFANGSYPNLKRPVYMAVGDRAGGFAACMASMEKEHRWIAGIFKSNGIQGHRRYTGYAEALCRAGLSVGNDRVTWYTTKDHDSSLDTCTLSALSTCMGVVCYNNEVALRILGVLDKADTVVPQQMELVSFDHNTLARLLLTPSLSLPNPKEMLGRLAAEELLHILGGRVERSILLPWNIK